MNYSRLIPPTDERGVEEPPKSTPQFRFIPDGSAALTGILVEEVDGVRHARAARFFWRGR
jgi:hypothetical protein